MLLHVVVDGKGLLDMAMPCGCKQQLIEDKVVWAYSFVPHLLEEPVNPIKGINFYLLEGCNASIPTYFDPLSWLNW